MTPESSARGLATLRVAVYGTWLVVLLAWPITSAGQLPSEWFSPRGFARWLPGWMWEYSIESTTLSVIHALAILGCSALLLGVRPFRPLAIVTSLLLVYTETISKGFSGYANHGQSALLYAALILPYFPASDRLSIYGGKVSLRNAATYLAGMYCVAMSLAVTYSLIGVERIAEGGWDIFTGDALLVDLVRTSHEYSRYGFNVVAWITHSAVLVMFLKMGFVVATIAEILSPFAIICRYFRYLWLVIILSFHVSTLITMNIFFWENVVLLLVLFVLFPEFIAKEVGGDSSCKDFQFDRIATDSQS